MKPGWNLPSEKLDLRCLIYKDATTGSIKEKKGVFFLPSSLKILLLSIGTEIAT